MGTFCCGNKIEEINENKKQLPLDYDKYGTVEKEEMILKEYIYYFT